MTRIGKSNWPRVQARFTLGKMNPRSDHSLIDRVNAAQDRVIASRLRRDERVLEIARKNLRRWTARDGRTPRPSFVEWQRILDRLSAREVAAFLVSGTPMARRLCQSSPFAGILTEAQRRSIRQQNETARV